MYTSNRMGLQIWDLPGDPYDHSQLATNFEAVDEHDHTTGKGKQIPQGGLAPDSVTAVELAPNAVTNTELADGAVSGSKIQNDSIGSSAIANNAVGTSEVQDASITAAKLSAGILPIGQVILWYRATSAVGIPTGWEICDGRPWSSVTNKLGVGGANWTTGNMPDMRGAFPFGASTSPSGSGATRVPDVGETGGANSIALSHSHTVNSHAHTVYDHTHPISSDGTHTHLVAFGSTFATNSHGRFDGNYQFRDINNNIHNTSFSHTYIVGHDVAAPAPINNAGAHSHGGITGGQGNFASSAEAPGTSAALGTQDNRPKHVGFLFLIRVQ